MNVIVCGCLVLLMGFSGIIGLLSRFVRCVMFLVLLGGYWL